MNINEHTNQKKDITLLRIVTVPMSFKHLIRGQARFFSEKGYQVIQVSANGSELADVIAYEKVEHMIIPFTRQITLLQDLNCFLQLRRVIKKLRPTIVHTQTPKAGLIGMSVALWCKVPLRIHTVGGMPLMETKGLKKQLLKVTEKITYKCAHVVLANSVNLSKWMVDEKLIASNHIKVLGHGSSNGIDANHYSPFAIADSKEKIRVQLAIPDDAFVFIFVGRLVRDKGIIELVNAFMELSKLHDNIYLLLVGPMEQHLDPLPESILQAISNHPHIISAGYQQEVRPYFKAADVLTFPSYREGFPNVVMQAGAMELPLIVTDINGCNEIVSPGVNGWIVPAKNTAQLKNAMLTAFEEKTTFLEIKSTVRKTITDRYEQHLLWSELEKVYHQALGN